MLFRKVIPLVLARYTQALAQFAIVLLRITWSSPVRRSPYWQFLIRLPMLVLTYLVSRSSTHPLSNLAGDLSNAGFKVKKEIRSKGGTFAMVVGGLP